MQTLQSYQTTFICKPLITLLTFILALTTMWAANPVKHHVAKFASSYDAVHKTAFQFSVADCSEETQLYNRYIAAKAAYFQFSAMMAEETECQTVAACGNDGSQNNISGNFCSERLTIGATGNFGMEVGVIATGYMIPPGATILSADIQFTAERNSTRAASFTVEGIAEDNAGPFTVSDDIFSRARTSATASWTPGTWTAGDAGTAQKTSDLTALVQEIVNRPGYTMGNNIGFVISGRGRRDAESFDTDPASAPVICITYDVPEPPSVTCDDCPDLVFASLDGVPNFPTVDLLNVCSSPDTISLLVYNNSECQISNVQVGIDFDEGLSYGGFVDSHYPEGTVGELDVTDLRTPVFLIPSIDSAGVFVINIGVVADCAVEIESEMPLNFDAEVNFSYPNSNGTTGTCIETIEEIGEYNGGVKIPVLNVLEVDPSEAEIATTATPECQTILVSQDGLQSQLSNFDFEVVGLDLVNYSVEGLSVNGITVTDYVIDPMTSILSANIDGQYFGPNFGPGANADDLFDVNEDLNIEICYGVEGCTDEAMVLNYNVFYGCNSEICGDVSSMDGAVNFVPNFGSTVVATSSNISYGGICGADLSYDITIESANPDSLDGLWQDLLVKYKACLGNGLTISGLMVNGVMLDASLWSITGSTLEIDFSTNTNPAYGLTDEDGGGVLNDLIGGEQLTFTTMIDIGCSDAMSSCDGDLACFLDRVEVNGQRNCGQGFQTNQPFSPAIDFNYGEISSSNNTMVIQGYGIPITEVFPTTSGVWLPGVEGFEYGYEFGFKNITPCASPGGQKMIVNVIAAGNRINHIRYEENSATYQGGAVSGVTSEYVIVDLGGGVTDTAGLTITIPAGDPNSSIHDYYFNLEYEGFCAPNDYTYLTYKVVEECNGCGGGSPDPCDIVRSCGNAAIYVQWRGTDCPCVMEGTVADYYRTNYGFQDKEMTMPLTKDDVPRADQIRLIPGDILFRSNEFLINDIDEVKKADRSWLIRLDESRSPASPLIGDINHANFLGWFWYDSATGIKTEIGIPTCMQNYTHAGRDNYIYPSIQLENFGVEGYGLSYNQAAPGGAANNYGFCVNDDNLNPNYPGNIVHYDMQNTSTTDEFTDHSRMTIYWQTPQSCPIESTSQTATGTSVDHVNPCFEEFWQQFPMKNGDKIIIEYEVPMIHNPAYDLQAINGTTFSDAPYLYLDFIGYTTDEATCSSSSVFSDCSQTAPVQEHLPGPVSISTDVVVEDCDTEVNYTFSLQNPVPTDLAMGELPWFENEYRPYFATEYLQFEFPNNMVYLGDGVIIMPDGSEVTFPAEYIQDEEGNLACINDGNGGVCCVAENSDTLAAMKLVDEQYLEAISLPYGWGPDGPNESGDYCDVPALVHLTGDPFPHLMLGGTETCTYGIRYSLSSLCPEDIESTDFRLEYQFAEPYIPTLARQRQNSYYGNISTADRDYTNTSYFYMFPINPFGEECSSDPLEGCNSYFQKINTDPNASNFAVNPMRQGGYLITTPQEFEDNSQNFPPLIASIDNILIADEAGINEQNVYMVCSEDNGEDFATHTNVVTSIIVPVTIDFLGAVDENDDPLTWMLVESTTEYNAYAVSSDSLQVGECATIKLNTELLFCPVGLDVATEICMTTTSGCIDPEKAALFSTEGGACDAVGSCYQYIAEEAEIQVEWMPANLGEIPLCTTVELMTIVKNVKLANIVDIETMWWFPEGLNFVPGSWKVSYPGGPSNTVPPVDIPDPTPDASQNSAYGTYFEFLDDGIWSNELPGDPVNSMGLPGVGSGGDSNFVMFIFEVETECDVFTSGSSIWFQADAADPCESRLQSMFVDSPPIIIENANPINFPQFFVFADPIEANCGVESNMTLTYLNTSPLGETNNTMVCMDIEMNDFAYVPGSVTFISPAGHNPNFTETENGNITHICFDIPDGIGPGEAFQTGFNFTVPEDVSCGAQDLGVAVSSEIMSQECMAQGIECSVNVLNSVNPIIEIDFLPPLSVTDQNLTVSCGNGDGTVPMCYTVDLSNSGPYYTNTVSVALIRDLNFNGQIDDFDEKLDSMDHVVLLDTDETTMLEGCFTIDENLACPVFLMIMQETNCVCDAQDYYYDSIEPEISDELDGDVVLCPDAPLTISNCGDYTYAVVPSGGANIVETVGGDSLDITLNPGFGVNTPVRLDITSQVGGCQEFTFSTNLTTLASFTFGPFDTLMVCNVGCKTLDLDIPSQYEDQVTVEWLPNIYLDDNTSLTPQICDPQGDVNYFVNVTFTQGSQVCTFDARFPIETEPQQIDDLFDQGSLCTETTATFEGPIGYSNYNWIAVDGSTETPVQAGSNGTFIATEEGTYVLEYYNIDDVCVSRSAPFDVIACPAFEKGLTSITPTAVANEYIVSYTITVENTSAYITEYDLYDMPGFDDDIVISAVTYTSDAGPTGGLALPVPATPGWELGGDVVINAMTTHTYVVNYTVSMDLLSLNGATPGDGMYTQCGQGSGPENAGPGEALYNNASLDLDDDGTPETEDDACGELPYLTMDKTLISTTGTGNNCYDIVYTIEVENIGGAVGTYDLVDDPGYDDDFTLTSAIYNTTAVGNPGGSLPTSTTQYTLADDQMIEASVRDSFTLFISVCLDLEDGPAGGDDDIYNASCGTTNGPTNPEPGEGLYNLATLDVNNDNVPDIEDEVCDDVPYLVLNKEVASMTIQSDGSFDVVYTIKVQNIGGAEGEYDLYDLPSPDDDIVFNSVSFSSDVPTMGTLTPSIPAAPGWVLANDQTIAAGQLYTYTLTANVSLELTDGIGDDVYVECGQGNGGTPQSGEGLFNQAQLDTNNDGIIDEVDDACTDISDLMMSKSLVEVSSQNADGSYDVTYEIVVTNAGGDMGTYDLFDMPMFDGDIVINTGSYSSDIPSSGFLSGTVPAAPGWELAMDQTIGSMLTQTYTVIVNVSMDLLATTAVDDNDYTACGEGTGGVPGPGQGLYNVASIDEDNDGMIDNTDDACGDLPFLVLDKVHTSTVETSLNCYDVTYTVSVSNIGGAEGVYDLIDDPMFDTDFEINSALYTTDAVGNPGGSLPSGSSTYDLADDQTILGGKVDTYVVTVGVCLDLEDGNVGNDTYDASCGTSNGPTDPTGGEGLHNAATLDTNNDGTPDQEAEACDDVPYYTLVKDQSTATLESDDTWTIVYTITVSNIGGADGSYNLNDLPSFDDDIEILSASYTSDAGPSNASLATMVPAAGWVLATDQAIGAFTDDVYTLTVNVDYDFFDGVAADGDDTYTACGEGGSTPGEAGEGLYNEALLDTNDDGTPDLTDDECQDLESVDVALIKTVSSSGPYTYGDVVSFEIEVFNQGTVTLTDIDVIDYPNCGYNYVGGSVSWLASGDDYVATIAGPIVPGQSMTVRIDYELVSCTSNTENAFLNVAEVTGMSDETGSDVSDDDIDSTPDAMDDNDGGGSVDTDSDDVVDGDGSGTPGDENPLTDEDDSDPAQIEVFDLALVKTLADEGPYSFGEDITFEITVTNQGNVTADNIEITDYIPSCLNLNDGDWSNNGDNTATYDVPTTLLAGMSVTVPVTVTVGYCQGEFHVNYAEISDATDGDGNPVTDIDSTPDDENGNDAGGNPNGNSDDTIDGDGNGTPGDDVADTDEDDHDPEIVQVQVYADIALIKTLGTSQVNPVMNGDAVQFQIQVINQGPIPLNNIEVTDYFPSCLVLNDMDWTNNNNGTATIMMSVANGGLSAPLAAGESMFVDIDFVATGCANGVIENWAEVSEFTGPNGEPLDDIDSTPDNDVNNDSYMNNNDVSGDGSNGGDEDDHDPEQIVITDTEEDIFDLALIKRLAPGQPATVGVGDIVVFQIEVINQGTYSVDNINVVDYIPGCMSLVDADWTDNGDDTANILLSVGNGGLAMTLAPGQSTFVNIDLQVLTCSGNTINWAEINGATDDDGNVWTDVDSTPDNNDGNDTYGNDDEVTGNGNTGGDEDDHDPANVNVVPVTPGDFDLALTKTLADGQPNPVEDGDLVTFDVTVINQGDIAADNIEVIDYLPACIALADADWTAGANNTATIMLSVANGGLTNALLPGTSTVVQITTQINGCGVGTETNWAEISGATDSNGDPVNDIDSTPDDENTDPYGFDDQTDGDGTNDEDDHDPEDIDITTGIVDAFDLALIKILSPGSANTVEQGDIVSFDIQVTNQGNVLADNIDVIDYYPSCLSLMDSDWTDNGSGTASISLSVANGALSAPLAPGQSTLVSITFEVLACTETTQVNFAEISGATDGNGNAANDVDSTPDTTNGNDAGGNPEGDTDNETNGDGNGTPGDNNVGGDEDDHDPEIINILPPAPIYDLALIKVLSLGQANPVEIGDNVSFDIQVTNQGDMAVDNIEVIDYLPSCLTLADSDWMDNGNGTASIILSVANGGLAVPLAPGQSALIDMNVTVEACAVGLNTNYAEISDFTDTNGDPVDDVDSTPDTDPDNDTFGGNDITDEDGTQGGDEDDHDPETITVIDPAPTDFDLALSKTLAPGQSANVGQGATVTFNVNVTNQGNLAADNIELVDYIPACAMLADANWTDNGDGTASKMLSVANGGLSTVLQPGMTIVVPVTIVLTNCTAGDVVNYAEIAGATDGDGNAVDDIDSTPDDTNGNDAGGVPDGDTDDTVDGDGSGTPGDDTVGDDEDDHDPEVVTVDPTIPMDFDLALTKLLSPGQTTPVSNGDMVSFEVNVFNQGDIAADNIEVTDYIPSCMSLNDTDWTAGANNTATILLSVANGGLATPLLPGTSTMVEITVAVNTCSNGTETNWAEISGNTDGAGNPVTDVDSTPDGDQDNDEYMIDNDTSGDGNNGGDEDDHDPAGVPVSDVVTPPGDFDLALIKTLQPGQSSVVMTGDIVDYDIYVINQGDVNADNIVVTDYIPGCFTLADNNWTDNGDGTASITMSVANGFLAGPILPGTSVPVSISLEVGTCSGTTQTNFAEISGATDGDGDPVNDIDSTPDADNTNDEFGDDDQTDGNGMDDEDDHDPETVTVEDELDPVFDLALSKTLPAGAPSTLPLNSVVTFNINVFNQGNVAADNIVVTDYLPSCASLQDNDWTDNGDGTASRTLSVANGELGVALAGGQSITVPITVDFNGCGVGPETNWAEISDATDEAGDPVSDVDSTPDDDQGNDTYTTDNDVNGDGNNGGDEDDHDPEVVTFSPIVDEEFDLALIKTLAPGQTSQVSNGDVVVFNITIYNQGNVSADNIKIVDYLPTCLTLNDSNWFYDAANHEAVRFLSVVDGDLATPLGPGQNITIPITVIVDGCTDGPIVNYAEIEDATDSEGDPVTDIDSTPDDDNTNDVFTNDNYVDGDATNGEDEDDSDPEILDVITDNTPDEFDAALIKVLAPGQINQVVEGDLITFEIQVTNQGDIAMDNIQVVDYFPTCTTLEDPDWTDNGNSSASVTMSVANGYLLSPLTPGQSTLVQITLRVGVCEAGEQTNFAEISGATDGAGDPVTDVDSTPDMDPDNDTYTTDNETDGDGMNGGDEDDHDPEIFEVTPMFDLALRKEVTSIGPYAYGDDVSFGITVFNQGNVPATNIELTEYVPDGYTFDAVGNMGWTEQVDGTLKYTITSLLGLTEDITVPLVLQLAPTSGSDTDWDNYAEISGGENEEGDPQEDVDSQMDDFQDNDNDVVPGDDDDDEIDEDGMNGGDEDDHDPANVDVFDLALNKVTTDEGPFRYGDQVTYTIAVFNQGNIPATNVVVNDSIPCGLEYLSSNDGDWSYDGGTGIATTTFTGVINPGSFGVVDITLEVQECYDDVTSAWTNVSEIESATDEEGNPQDDIDSDPDDDPNNDGDPTNDEVDGDPNDPNNPDEDDHDPEIIEVFDLALQKQLVPQASYEYGDELTFNINVINQGNVDAFDVEVSDYIPAGYSFDSGTNPLWTLDASTDIATRSIAFVEAGETVTISIILTLVETGSGGSDYFNGSEISDADDNNNPDDEDPTDADSTPDNDPDNDNDVTPGDDNDDEITDTPNDPQDPNDDDEDDSDPAGPFFFDLATIKQPAATGPYTYGEIVEFNFTLFNQGTITATNIDIVDYIPCGYIYMSSNDANGWTYDAVSGNATRTIAGPLAPAATDTYTISLQVQPCYEGEASAWTNVTEITGGDDENGDPQDDIDSDPDNDPDNDGEVTDDETEGSGSCADCIQTVVVPTGGTDPVIVDEVMVDGAVLALPNYPYDLQDPAQAAQFLADCIALGYNVEEDFDPVTGMLSIAVLYPGQDFESFNINGGEEFYFSCSDCLGPDPDEDDHDPATNDIFDLAFIKYIDDKGPYGPGDIAEFKMVVYNQGNVDAYNVEITDYLNEGYIFDQTSNAGWTMNSGLVQTTIEGPIVPGDSVELTLYLEVTVPDGASVASWYNEAEISAADDDTDPDNEDPVDADSTPDTDPDNDNDLVDGPDDDPIFDEEDDNDNVIDEDPNDPFGNGDDDEDDNDAADILVVGGLGDTVWKDLDGDGIQDPNEPGVEGVTVILSDCEGNMLGMLETDENGFYFFNNLIPGDYQVRFDISNLPAGCAFTQQDIGDDALDSDVDLFGFAPCTTIEGGEYDSTFDAGLLILVNIGDYVWHDLDGDGIQESGEPGIEGVDVFLYDVDFNLIATTTTDANGYYLFEDVYPDTYFIAFDDPEGFDVTFPDVGNDLTDSDVTNSIINSSGSTTDLFTIEYGQEDDLSFDAGYYMCIPIGETVWYDVDTDDVEDVIENGINGLLVTLWRLENGSWVEWDYMYTGLKPGTPSDDGYYKFCAPPGTYHLAFDLPPTGLVLAQPNVGGDDNIDSDVTNANGFGTTNSYTVLSGDEICTIGAGFYPMAEVGSFVWNDANRNGIQESNESPLEGVKVQAYDMGNNMINEVETNADGEYNMDYLQQESYYLKFTPPSGYGATIANVGSDDKDSDITHTYGYNTTQAYAMSSGEKIENVDAGLSLGVLPVEWLYVRASNREDHNLVSWATTLEINSDYYEVERRLGNEDDFKSIGRVAGKGNSSIRSEYNFKDEDVSQSGIYYYRIKQVDLDGRTDYSDRVIVSIDGGETGINIYPNPATNTAMIQVTGAGAKDATVMIFNKEGKLIRSGLTLEEGTGSNYELRLDVNSYLPGVYTVKIETTTETWTEKLIIIR